MTPTELRKRTFEFAVSVAKAARGLELHASTRHAASQLLRAAASVAANYRAAGLARSRAEFISKITVVLEEADETVFWMDLLAETDPSPAESLRACREEAGHLVRIFAASKRTARRNQPASRPRPRRLSGPDDQTSR